ncbi:MAG TPA: hypothetical protein G4O08_12010 [Anaerolineae bacterium]|nr:hypothetical protein [Anaerolineae bacterium]
MNEQPAWKAFLARIPLACFWIAGGAAAGFLLLVLAVFVGPMIIQRNPQPTPTWVFSVIVNPSPTAEPTLQETALPEQTPEPEATTEILEASTFSVGDLVEVRGTEGDGLRIRGSPGFQGDILFLAVENEVFMVQDGPVLVDDLTWWYLVNPYSSEVRGWAVSVYLQALEAE